MKIYISPSIPQNYNMLGPDISEIFSLFNVYFKEDSSSKGNFIFNAKVDRKSGTLAYDDQTPYLMEANYAYAFLTADDWAAYQENPEVKALLEKMYEAKTENSGKLVLLVKKP